MRWLLKNLYRTYQTAHPPSCRQAATAFREAINPRGPVSQNTSRRSSAGRAQGEHSPYGSNPMPYDEYVLQWDALVGGMEPGGDVLDGPREGQHQPTQNLGHLGNYQQTISGNTMTGRECLSAGRAQGARRANFSLRCLACIQERLHHVLQTVPANSRLAHEQGG